MRFRWKIVITTAPRQKSFLQETFTSLMAAGWGPDEITVFAEPGTETFDQPTYVWRQHPVTLGPWRNWRAALTYLAGRDVEYVAIVQDDLIFRPRLRKYLDATIGTGVFSPYLSQKDASTLPKQGGGWTACRSGWQLCGACFFAMGRATAEDLDQVLPATVAGNKHIDAVLGKHLLNAKLPLYVHCPSLVQHLADDCSTLGYGANPWCRTAFQYCDEPIETCE